jgi:glutamate transport system permease protein
MSGSVLYDAPGPVARRRVLIGSVIAGLFLLGAVVLVLLRLHEQGQFAADRWSPLFNPNDSDFAAIWSLLRNAFWATMSAAILAMSFSLLLGTLLAVARVTSAWWYRWAVVGLIEILRGIPVVLAIFFAARVLPQFGLDLSTRAFLVIGLTAYNMVVLAEIIRAGLQSLPRGQSEAAKSIGLTRGQSLRLVLLPQAFRVMLPALISQLVVVVKDTSLGFLIAYQELLATGRILIQNLGNPLQVYLLIAVIFIIVNWILSRFAVYLEKRLSQASAAEPEAEDEQLTGAGASRAGA